MSNKNKYREDIELFYEKTGEVVRLIHFKHPNSLLIVKKGGLFFYQ